MCTVRSVLRNFEWNTWEYNFLFNNFVLIESIMTAVVSIEESKSIVMKGSFNALNQIQCLSLDDIEG